MENKYASVVQEKHIEKITGGWRPTNSGGTKYEAGDVLTDIFFIEAKTTTKEKESFAIKKEWLEKMDFQCFSVGRTIPVLAFRFAPDAKMDYYVLPEYAMIDYMRLKEKEFEGDKSE